MHLVVVLRRPEPVETAVARLAERLAISPYEARNRVGGELPHIVAVIADAEAAQTQMRALNADGFVAAVLSAARIEHDVDRDLIASLSFGPSEFEATLRSGETRAVAYDDVERIVHGVRLASVTDTQEQKVKKFSAGRALLSGGLITSKTTMTSTTSSRETREAFLYVFASSSDRALAMYERRTNYAFLGAKLAPSSYANFLAVLAEFTARVGKPRIEGRLAKPIGLGILPLPPPGMDPGTWKSDVAVAVVRLGA